MVQHSRIKILLAVLLVITSILPGNSYAQDKKAQYVVDDVDCNREETVKAMLDFAHVAQKKDETIFIIARLGTGETSRELSKGRLYAPKQYLIETRGVPEDKLVAAEGDRVKGPGQVEIYVNGKLYVVFKMKRQRNFGQNRYCKIIYD